MEMKMARMQTNVGDTMDINDPKIKKDVDDLSTRWQIDDRKEPTRMRGSIVGIHPPKKNADGEVKGGFIWVKGDNDQSYFGHITQLAPEIDIYDLRIGQQVTFVPGERRQGPTAELIRI
jgi:cold shock CspA family protein